MRAVKVFKTGLVVFVLSVSVSASSMAAREAALSPPWLSEVSRLESMRQKRALYSEERQRLTALYFLQDKCEKVKEVYADRREPTVPLDPTDMDLLCACDGKCDLIRLSANARFQQKLAAFRAMLTSGQPFDDKAVQKIWVEIQSQPEAQYVAFEHLKKSKSEQHRKLASALYRSLSALNLEPR